MISADLAASLRLCFVEARALRYPLVSLEQLLVALLHNPRAAQALRACSVDIDRLHVDLTAVMLSNSAASAEAKPTEPKASPEVERALERAIVLVQSTRGRVGMAGRFGRAAWQAVARGLAFLNMPFRGAVNGADMLVAVFAEKDSPAVQALQHHGATRLDLTRYLAHGISKRDPAEPPALQGQANSDANVVLFNDDFTPMEFVVKVLQEHFALDLESAARVMLKVHREGCAVCGRFAADVAVAKVERVRAAAREEEHPLHCVAMGPGA
ncbi:MAG TPA: ATP-dependent Clp protease adaptor ClpS [Roseateles sp.]